YSTVVLVRYVACVNRAVFAVNSPRKKPYWYGEQAKKTKANVSFLSVVQCPSSYRSKFALLEAVHMLRLMCVNVLSCWLFFSARCNTVCCFVSKRFSLPSERGTCV
uniref:Uncharacterized protein n=1 Tax=Anopheles minimus TaxID=112268 RepID=A0A182WN69_9DIPT